jgi:hypothetical protein
VLSENSQFQTFDEETMESHLRREQTILSKYATKICKLTYGKDGLIAFLERLFRGISTTARNEISYYTSLKKNLQLLEQESYRPE